MLKCEIHPKKNLIHVKASGTGKELTAEACMIIQKIYLCIYRKNRETANLYKNALLSVLLDPESLVWKEPPA